MQKKLLKDVNGVEMRTGDIVEITGGYYKHDNGLYFVRHSPGDVGWSGGDYPLRRLCKSGKLSKSNNTASWPLFVPSNVRNRDDIRAHNEKNAKIKIIKNFKKNHVIEWFQKEYDYYKQTAEELETIYGSEFCFTKQNYERASFTKSVLERLKESE